MSNFLKKLNIKEDETVIRVLRRYPLSYLGSIIVAFILIGGPFFFLYLLIQWGKWGMIVFGGILLVGLLYLIRKLVVWRLNVLVITNQRVIDVDQRGFFSRLVSEVKLEQIQDVAYQIKGISQTLFHYGTLIIQPANLSVHFEANSIKNPGKIKDIINDLRELAQQEGKISPKELTRLLKTIGDDDGEVKVKIANK